MPKQTPPKPSSQAASTRSAALPHDGIPRWDELRPSSPVIRPGDIRTDYRVTFTVRVNAAQSETVSPLLDQALSEFSAKGGPDAVEAAIGRLGAALAYEAARNAQVWMPADKLENTSALNFTRGTARFLPLYTDRSLALNCAEACVHIGHYLQAGEAAANACALRQALSDARGEGMGLLLNPGMDTMVLLPPEYVRGIHALLLLREDGGAPDMGRFAAWEAPAQARFRAWDANPPSGPSAYARQAVEMIFSLTRDLGTSPAEYRLNPDAGPQLPTP